MKYEHTARQMAEKLMEFNRDPSDYEEDIVPEIDYLTGIFKELMDSEHFEVLMRHLDIMFMHDVFK